MISSILNENILFLIKNIYLIKITCGFISNQNSHSEDIQIYFAVYRMVIVLCIPKKMHINQARRGHGNKTSQNVTNLITKNAVYFTC
jgi:hypothetical protein